MKTDDIPVYHLENVLTEFPTFRDVPDLVQNSWTGKTVYDVWNMFVSVS